MDNVSPAALNAMFVGKLESGEMTKTAALGAAYVKKLVRETSYAYKVQPPQQVTKADLQRSTTHEGFTKIIDIEPDSSAVVLDFRAQPKGEWVTSTRAEVAFWTFSSKRFQKTEQELLSWEMPITKVLEINTVKDIQTQIDKSYTRISEDALVTEQLAGRINKNIGVDISAGAFPNKRGFQNRADLIRLFDTMDGDAKPIGTLLMSKVMFNSYSALPSTEVGSIVSSEVTVDGYRYNTLLGVKCVTSVKTGPSYDYLLYPNEVFLFTEPDYLGRMYVLNNMKFWINKIANLIEWQSWMDMGMVIVGTNGVARLVYYDPADDYTDATANPLSRVLFTGARSGLTVEVKDPRNIPFTSAF
jgi:hypothetical protein